MKNKSTNTIGGFILANPTATVRQVMNATGSRPSSIHTMFTFLRGLYNKTEINSAGVYTPKGYPPLTQQQVDALNRRRFTASNKRKVKKPLVTQKEFEAAVKKPDSSTLKFKPRVEAIDLIESNGLGFHLGMVVEYICMASRLGTNDGLRSLELAKAYLDRAITKNVELNTSR